VPVSSSSVIKMIPFAVSGLCRVITQPATVAHLPFGRAFNSIDDLMPELLIPACDRTSDVARQSLMFRGNQIPISLQYSFFSKGMAHLEPKSIR
jgi:hypothetical protein